MGAYAAPVGDGGSGGGRLEVRGRQPGLLHDGALQPLLQRLVAVDRDDDVVEARLVVAEVTAVHAGQRPAVAFENAGQFFPGEGLHTSRTSRRVWSETAPSAPGASR